MARSWIDKFVYRHTEKPKHYREVKKPPKTLFGKMLHPQEARQVQYNKWSKYHKRYSGSYLPKDEEKLLKQGWIDESEIILGKNKKSEKTPRFYRRKSTNQWVRTEKGEPRHWHWYNWWERFLGTLQFRKNRYKKVYYDKFGKPCDRGSEESHIQGDD